MEAEVAGWPSFTTPPATVVTFICAYANMVAKMHSRSATIGALEFFLEFILSLLGM
jgi:hypothetical protein